MFEEVGHHVEKIRRVQYGPLTLDVPPGDWRTLTLLEVAKLKTAVSGPKLTLPPPSTPAPLYTPKASTTKPVRVAKSRNSSRHSRSSKSPSFKRSQRSKQDR